MARYLKIRIRENGRTKVKLTQSVSNIDNLVGLLDEVMKQRIERQGIDLAQIVTDVRRQGNAPTQGFELIEGSKHIEVFQSRHDRNLRDWLGLLCSPRFSHAFVLASTGVSLENQRALGDSALAARRPRCDSMSI